MRRRNVKDLYHPHQENSLHQDWNDGPMFDFWEATLDEGEETYWVRGTERGTWWKATKAGKLTQPQDEPVDVFTPEGPMMNYWWPLGRTIRQEPEELAWEMRHFNTCLVYEHETELFGVALTGGGMDLSWELAASAVACGYFPWTELRINQGSPESTWHYGKWQIGEANASRVRAALRWRHQLEINHSRQELGRMQDWK